jgi:hypothetical protein
MRTTASTGLPLKLATTTARTHQAAASSMHPAASASVPSAVPVSPRSWMIRASIGNAVMARAAPRNSAACHAVVRSEKRPGIRTSQRARAAPSAKGATIPDSETASALRARRRKRSVWNPTPTKNM